MNPPTATILDRFRSLCANRPEAPLLTWIDDQGRDHKTLRVAEARSAAEAVAAHLVERVGLKPGDRALLVYPPGLDFPIALLGCLMAGVLPVPVVPPHPLKLKKDLAAFTATAADCGASVILTNREYELGRHVGAFKAFVMREGARWPELPWHTTDTVKPRGAFGWHAPAPDDVAFLQYTSGSTGEPKGVMITHRNVLGETDTNARDVGLGPDARAVLWLPLFHSFCLINGLMNALVGHGHLHLFSPLAFMARPALWPEVMSRVRATHTAGANFALELLMARTTAEERSRWDLSALEGLLCGAEPVREATLEAFEAAFAVSGLKPGAVRPCYGLSEHTVSVTTGTGRRLSIEPDALAEGIARPAPHGQVLVGCGRVTKSGAVVRIVDPVSRHACAPGVVGEIWVDSPTKAAGYFGKPRETEETFQARLEGEDDGRTYLRTGDLGFFWDEELYPTGRLKELIIVRGRNYYPTDIEESLTGCHPAVQERGLVAFAAPDPATGTEAVVVVAELREERVGPELARQVARALRDEVARRNQLDCRHVVIVGPGGVPRTGSGKIRRRECRQAFERGTLHTAPDTLLVASFAAEPAPAAPAEAVDRRLIGLDPAFERLIADTARRFTMYGQARGGRAFHLQATALAGELTVAPDPALPAHGFFGAGRRYPVVVRLANGAQDDDAAFDNRGATLRVLDPARPDALDRPLLDLLLTTGRCFLAATASDFARWIASSEAEREAWVQREPHLGTAAWEMVRRADSFATLHYHSKVASHFVAADGTRAFVRYRLVPADGAPDGGFLTPSAPLPPDRMPREAGDGRSRTCLHDDARSRVAGAGLAFRLQVQLRPELDADDTERALDCTRPWDESAFPWREMARLTLGRVLPDGALDGLAFNPCHAPADLAMVLARDPGATASLNHLRSLVYDMAAAGRTGAPLPAGLSALMARATSAPAPAPAPGGPTPRRVCVVGAGVSGLTVARELERRGHQVTVLERGAEVAGKCGSVQVGAHWYDLGGHFCSSNYQHVWQLVQELGLPIELTIPGKPYDLETNRVYEAGDPAAMGAHWLRYIQARDRDFPELKRPGYHHVARALAMPARDWIRANGLEGFARALEVIYTSSGYGYLDDPELPVLYFLKSVDTTVGAAPGGEIPPAWTIDGGFLRVWKRVAAELRDVRLGVEVRRVERTGAGVTVHTNDGALAFDELVVATPLHEVPPYLEATAEERAVFSRVRHFDYYTTIITASGLPENAFYLLTPHATDPRSVGRTLALHHRYPGDDVYLHYANGRSDQDGEAIVRMLHEDVARMGGRVHAVHGQWKWAYFPHFRAADVADGIYDRLEALQGRNHTYFVGSLFNFELVECNVAYAKDLVARFFDAETPRAQPAPTAVVEAARPAPQALLATLQAIIASELDLAEPPAPSAVFMDLGLDSLRAMALLQRLSAELGRSLLPSVFFDHPTLEALARHLAPDAGEPPAPAMPAPAPMPAPPPPEAPRPAPVAGPERSTDVVFTEEDGIGLLLDVWTPTGPSNGLGVVHVASLKGRSGRDVVRALDEVGLFEALCARGFTVFAARPGSAPRFDAADQERHVQRAIGWVKAHAPRFGVDANRLALMGLDTGAGLAIATALALASEGPAERVAAVVAFHAPPAADLSVPRPEAASRTVPPLLAFHALGDGASPYPAAATLAAALRAAGGRSDLVARDAAGVPWAGMREDFALTAEWLLHVLTGRVVAPPLRSASAPRPLLEPLRATPRLRLFCFHHMGGSAELFAGWPDGLPRTVEVRALSLPGRGPRAEEVPYTRFDDLLDALEAEIRPLTDRPFAFFGHSFGALVAFELARRLRRAGQPQPVRLFLSAFKATQDAVHTPADEAAGRFMAPETVADVTLGASWRYEAGEPLDVPFTVLGADDDPYVAPAELEAWRSHTTAGFEVQVFPGQHFYVRDRQVDVLALVASRLEGQEATAVVPKAGEADELTRFAARWRARPSSYEGSLARHDLGWIARAADADGRPLFPAALEMLLASWPAGRSPLPQSDFIERLVVANTLLRWNTDEAATRRALGDVFEAVGRMERLEVTQPYGRHFQFDDLFGYWITAVYEAERLLASAGDRLEPARRVALEGLIAPHRDTPARQGLERLDHAACFARNLLFVHFGEVFPDHAFTTPEARAHAHEADGLPGFAVPTAARYAEATRDPLVLARLQALLDRPHDGLWPAGALIELVFGLHYLHRGGLDLRRHFPREVARLAAYAAAEGVGLFEGAPWPDPDVTAIVLQLAHELGLPARLPVAWLERFWSADHDSYIAFDGRPVPNVSTEVHMLEAVLAAPDATAASRRAIWQRTTRLLASRPWHEKYHLSPFFIWELVACMGFRHAHRFPDDPTEVHLEALDQILRHQTPGGGFHSAFAPGPNPEETGLAVLGLRAALEALPPGTLRARVEASLAAAQAYLGAARERGEASHPQLWVGKALATAPHLIGAIVQAALADAPRGVPGLVPS